MKQIYDMVGNEIKIGSYISYPGRSGSSIWLSIARVDEINITEDFAYNRETKNYDLPVDNLLFKVTTVQCNWWKTEYKLRKSSISESTKRCVVIYPSQEYLEKVGFKDKVTLV